MKLIIAILCFLFFASVTVSAQSKTVNVKFAQGTSEATYTNSFSGYDTVDFLFSARANQQLTATLVSSTGNKAIFTVMQNGDRIADDALETTDWTGPLPNSGKYSVRVYMTRAEARRTKSLVKFTLRIRITG